MLRPLLFRIDNFKVTGKKFQKDLNNKLPHEAIDFIQNSSWKLG